MNNKLIKRRLSKTRFVGRLLAQFPFVRCVILNGSLAQNKSKESSDIDILIIAKSRRIFSARFFVNVFGTIFKIKRSKDEVSGHAGKFCFNYFLTEDFLKIPTGRGEKMDCYCADNYSHSRFVAGDMKLYEKFMKENQGLFEKYGFKITKSKLQMTNKNPNYKFENDIMFSLRIKSGMIHCIGDWFERKVKLYQIKKIESDPRTKKYPDLIVYNDQELRFHPPKSELRIKN